MNVAVVGLGFGKNHVQALTEMDFVQDIAICDLDKNLLKQVAKKADIDYKTDDYKEILADDNIDALTLAVPHNLHAEMIKQAIEAEKHVYCEKPLTTTLSAGKKIVEFASDRGIKITAGFNMRYYEQYQKAKDLITEGKLGNIFLVECFARADARGIGGFRLSKEKAGGGCLIDSGAHRFDLLRWLFGPFNSIYNSMGNFVLDNMGGEDTAVVNIKFADDIIANLICSWATVTPEWDEGMKIYGTKGSISIWDHNLSLSWLKKGGKEKTFKYTTSYEDTVGISLYNFLNEVKKGNLKIDKARALSHLQAIEASYKSAAGNQVIELKNLI